MQILAAEYYSHSPVPATAHTHTETHRVLNGKMLLSPLTYNLAEK